MVVSLYFLDKKLNVNDYGMCNQLVDKNFKFKDKEFHNYFHKKQKLPQCIDFLNAFFVCFQWKGRKSMTSSMLFLTRFLTQGSFNNTKKKVADDSSS